MLLDNKILHNNYKIQTANSIYTLITTCRPNIYKITGGLFEGSKEIQLMNEISQGCPITATFTSNPINGRLQLELWGSSDIVNYTTFDVNMPENKTLIISTKNSKYTLKETNIPCEYIISGGKLPLQSQYLAFVMPCHLQKNQPLIATLNNGDILATSPVQEITTITPQTSLIMIPDIEDPEYM